VSPFELVKILSTSPYKLFALLHALRKGKKIEVSFYKELLEVWKNINLAHKRFTVSSESIRLLRIEMLLFS